MLKHTVILIGLGDFYFEIEELAIQNICKEVDLGVIDWQILSSNTLPMYLYFFLKKSCLTNWIFNLQKSILKLIFAGYIGSKTPI